MGVYKITEPTRATVKCDASGCERVLHVFMSEGDITSNGWGMLRSVDYGEYTYCQAHTDFLGGYGVPFTGVRDVRVDYDHPENP